MSQFDDDIVMDNTNAIHSPLKTLLNKSPNLSHVFGLNVSFKMLLETLLLQFILNLFQQKPSIHQNQPYISVQLCKNHIQSNFQNMQNSSAMLPQSNIVPQGPMLTAEPQDALNSIKIQNCVATVNLGCDLNLRKINFRTRNSEYNPARFHGVIMRIREPRCTALIFRSGKVVCTGARNEFDANLGIRKFARILQKLGYPVSIKYFHKLDNFLPT